MNYIQFPTPDSQLPISNSRFPTPDSRLPIPDSRFPTPLNPLPITKITVKLPNVSN
ncbi:MAG: hypothetical protein F6K63_18995 [Moorea sp. SIO1G6]|uniref:hypothetical protein n=1 Tax=Moorena sp. SIO1G6 TaxID=2607840 RepID=UPI0013C1A3EA|nr:hypothetical protein [Moorena sp. SIO1G6]NET66361.1 hypothetical protein [Moorena sp. SIO1G6]